MPFGISDKQADCSGWATVKQEEDGTYTTIGCHETKQDAVDQMVVVSLSEDIEPLGEIRVDDETTDDDAVVMTRDDQMVAAIDEALTILMKAKSDYMNDETVEPEIDESEQMTGDEYRAVDLSAPEFMRASARRGLRLHEQGLSGDGLMPATVADARRMAAGDISERKWRKIPAWIARHIGDLDAIEGDEITAGLVAMLLWGGGSTRESAERAMAYGRRIVERLDDDEPRADPPAPKKDQIFGSDKNPEGTAKDKTGDITLDDATEKALQNKADEHNADMKEKNRPDWTRVRVGALRAVYRRGAGAFSGSHRPNIGRAQWAMARVNAFLYLARTGKPQNPKYIGDNDLLDPDHPKYSDSRGTPLDDQTRCEDGTQLDMIAAMTTETPEREHRWCITGADERRVAYTTLEMREVGDGRTLVGYAAVFDSPSEPLPFTEYVKRGAFTKTIKDGADVRLLIDHEGVPLARTKSGTLTLEEDDRGLKVMADLDPANPDAARVMSAMKRGDLSQMSFAFRTIKDHWSDDRTVRELKEVQLFDVSVVTFPAYEQTMAELRSHEIGVIVSPTTDISVRRAQVRLARHR